MLIEFNGVAVAGGFAERAFVYAFEEAEGIVEALRAVADREHARKRLCHH